MAESILKIDRIEHTFRVPRMFWDDHTWRYSDDGQPVGVEISTGKYVATVRFDTDEQWLNFVHDVDYYAYCGEGGEWNRMDDPGLYALGQSAIRTRATILREHAKR